MGDDSERAAMIYLHGSDARQQAIADTLSKLASDELERRSQRKATGTDGSHQVRKRREAS